VSKLVWAAAALTLLAAGCTSAPSSIATPPGGSVRAADLPACPAPGAPASGSSPLPDLTLPCLNGSGQVPLRRVTGTPTVLNLWASWCAPCKEELPVFAALSRSAGSTVRVLGVASLDVPGNSVSYAADSDLPFPSVQDRDGTLGRDLRTRGLPATVLVRADGSVADVYQGPPLTGASLRALLRDKLGVHV
jgi:cytochrome c biogenesis protein CcmG/thiol:disulfide interchange protein DsbE